MSEVKLPDARCSWCMDNTQPELTLSSAMEQQCEARWLRQYRDTVSDHTTAGVEIARNWPGTDDMDDADVERQIVKPVTYGSSTVWYRRVCSSPVALDSATERPRHVLERQQRIGDDKPTNAYTLTHNWRHSISGSISGLIRVCFGKVEASEHY